MRTGGPRIRYQLDMTAAIAAIKALNNSVAGVAADRLLNFHFPSVEQALAPETVAERVVLLDSLWGTRLFVESGAADLIATNLAKNSARLIATLHNLGPDDLERKPDKVYRAAKEALPTILDHTPGAKYRQNYSFAAKFFHWCTRRHFPIVDRNARKVINRWQNALRVRPVVRSDTAAMSGLTYIQEYQRWIDFYGDLIAGLSTAARKRLIRVDFDSQPKHYRVKNSLLRILDKVFYYQGGGRGLGRVAE